MPAMHSEAINQAFLFKVYLKGANGTDDIELPSETLETVAIKEGILNVVPRMELKIADKGNFTELYPLYDGDVLSVHFGSSDEDPNINKMEFIISDIKITPTYEAKSSNLTITAYMNCSDLFYPYKNRGMKGNSVDVLSQIASEMGYTLVNRNSITPSDNMTWFQKGSNIAMMNHLIQRSCVVGDVPFVYGTHNMNFEYACFNKCIEQEAKFIARYDIQKAQDRVLSDTDKGMMYFKNFDTISNNGENKRKSGYGVKYYNYDGSGGVKNTEVTSKSKQTDIFNVQNKFADSITDRYYYGWNHGNAHDDYHKGIVQNYVFKNELFSNTIEMAVNPLTTVSVMDSVMLDYPSFMEAADATNDVWSGRYCVVGISHTMSYGGTYDKSVLLARNGMNQSNTRKALVVK